MITTARTVALIQARRAMGIKSPRRRMPRDRFPTAIAREYTAALWRVCEAYRGALEPALEAIVPLVAQARAERGDSRADAGESKRIAALLQAAKDRLAVVVSTEQLEEIARLFAERTATAQRLQLLRQTKAALGVEVFVSDRGVAGSIEAFVAHNVSLIKDIGAETARRIEQKVLGAVAGGTLQGNLATDLQSEFGFAQDRAALIANDQIGKAYGDVTTIRHTEMGVEAFIWRTSRDRRVRGTPGGKYPKAFPSHYHREGHRYLYSDPPKGRNGEPELPGKPVRCRCTAEPIFDSLLADL